MRNINKPLIITIIISILILLMLSFASYTIYIISLYDKKTENQIIEQYNQFKFNDLYKEFITNKSVSQRSYNRITSLMYNKINLEKIYESYYKNSELYNSLDEFIEEFYYGYGEISKDNIIFSKKGKNTFFNRKDIKIKGIKVKNKNYKSYLGLINNIEFNTYNNSIIKIDGNSILCDTKCTIETMFGGVHEIEIISNGYTYYSLLNIYKDNTIIKTNDIKNLITVNKKIDINIEDFKGLDSQSNKIIDTGIYGLIECHEETCPLLNNTYLSFDLDNTFTYTIYNSLNENPTRYKGKYKITNGYLTLEFDNEDRIITFEILNENIFYNNTLKFQKK